MKAPSPSHFLVAVAVLHIRVITATCYNPNGSPVTNPAFQPCNQVVGAMTMCCGTNWTNGIVGDDTCEPNGLCLNSYQGGPLYWRGSCTDPTWKSPNCLANLCTDYSQNGDPTVNVALTDCGDGSWCCQGGNKTCCEQKLGVVLAATIGVASTSAITLSIPSTSSSSTTSTTTSITTSSSSMTASAASRPPPDPNVSTTASSTLQPQPEGTTSTVPQPQPEGTTSTVPQPQPEGLSSGAKIGIGLGVAFAAVLIAATIGFWIHTRKRRRNSTEAKSGSNSHGPDAQELPVLEKSQELPEKNGLAGFQHELTGDLPPPAELAATRYSRGMLADRRPHRHVPR